MEALKQCFIKGKIRDIYFGMPAIEYVYEKIKDHEFMRLAAGEFKTTDVKIIAHFVFAGLMGGAERKDEVPDFSYSDIYDEVEKMMFDGDTNKVIESVGIAFSESNTVKWTQKKDVKKKEAA